MIDDLDRISLIDWEQAVIGEMNYGQHNIAGLGFHTWGEQTSEEIDWYGVSQIAHYLLQPIITQSDLVQNYSKQLLIEGIKAFENYGFPQEDIIRYKELVLEINKRFKTHQDKSSRKILRPFLLENKESIEIEDFKTNLINGLFSVFKNWHSIPRDRLFPVHYYGLDKKMGIAFSDLGIVYSLRLFERYISDDQKKDYEIITNRCISDTISTAMKNEFDEFGLFDGLSGTIWLLIKFGRIEDAKKMVDEYFEKIVNNSKSYNLYNGLSGSLLLLIDCIQYKILDKGQMKILREILNCFCRQYIENPKRFIQIGKGSVISNNPYEQHGGILYGHGGVGWLFGKAYKTFGEEHYKQALNLCIENELMAYSEDSNGAMEYNQGYRLLPYLSMGSSGMLQLFSRYKDIIYSSILEYLPNLRKAVEVQHCVFPGLFNGWSGLVVSQHVESRKSEVLNQFCKNIQRYLISIESGICIAGDAGLRITTDIASGSAGILLAIDMLERDEINFLPI